MFGGCFPSNDNSEGTFAGCPTKTDPTKRQTTTHSALVQTAQIPPLLQKVQRKPNSGQGLDFPKSTDEFIDSIETRKPLEVRWLGFKAQTLRSIWRLKFDPGSKARLLHGEGRGRGLPVGHRQLLGPQRRFGARHHRPQVPDSRSERPEGRAEARGKDPNGFDVGRDQRSGVQIAKFRDPLN